LNQNKLTSSVLQVSLFTS